MKMKMGQRDTRARRCAVPVISVGTVVAVLSSTLPYPAPFLTLQQFSRLCPGPYFHVEFFILFLFHLGAGGLVDGVQCAVCSAQCAGRSYRSRINLIDAISALPLGLYYPGSH